MKHVIKLTIGALLYGCWRLFSPRRLTAVREQFFASHALSLLDRQVLAFMLWRMPMATGTASSYWAGNAGCRFHAHPDHRMTLEVVAADDIHRRPMLDDFAERAAGMLRPGATSVEAGCGAGGNLLYLRDRLAGRGFRFQGFDINDVVIASNRRHNCTDLEFAVRDCFNAELAVPGDLGVICCAVFIYAQEADIARFLRGVIRSTHGRIPLGLSEPTLDPEASDARAHNNLALLHGYRRILRELNFRQLFETLRQEEGKSSHLSDAV